MAAKVDAALHQADKLFGDWQPQPRAGNWPQPFHCAELLKRRGRIFLVDAASYLLPESSNAHRCPLHHDRDIPDIGELKSHYR